MKFLVSLAIAGLAITANMRAGIAKESWFTEYSCGDYNITLREVGQGNVFSYSANSPEGKLLLSNGKRDMGDKSWVYSFNNHDTVYSVEDIWGTAKDEPKAAFLRVIQKEIVQGKARGRVIMDKACEKKNYGV